MIIDLGRDELLSQVRNARSIDDERAAALLAITFGRAGDVEVMLELARLVDLGRHDGVVESLSRVMVDQQQPDGSIGRFGVELRLLGSQPGADAAARLAATRLFVDACGQVQPHSSRPGVG